jgi:hypothetical protein
MAVGVYFAPRALSKEQYDEVTAKLEAAGAGKPAGRQYHVSFVGHPGSLHVFEVFDSMDSLNAYAETLMPVLAEVGVDPGRPVVAEVHNIIAG